MSGGRLIGGRRRFPTIPALKKRGAMSEDGTKKLVVGLMVSVGILIFILIGWHSSRSSSRMHQPKKEYGKIYRSNDGRYYARSHDRSGFSDWEYTSSGDSGGGESSGSFSTGSWSRVTTTPSGMSATSKVVAEEAGKPTGEVEEESAVANNEEITEST